MQCPITSRSARALGGRVRLVLAGVEPRHRPPDPARRREQEVAASRRPGRRPQSQQRRAASPPACRPVASAVVDHRVERAS